MAATLARRSARVAPGSSPPTPLGTAPLSANWLPSFLLAARIDLLKARAEAGECELVAKGRILNDEVGFLYTGGLFTSDRQYQPPIHDSVLRLFVVSACGSLTYTCVPPGSGMRIGIDRDLDGHLDGDERAAGTNPADPHSP